MKATARLHAHLLARKGEALPAIRRQRLALADADMAQGEGLNTEDMTVPAVHDTVPQPASFGRAEIPKRLHHTDDINHRHASSGPDNSTPSRKNTPKKRSEPVKVTDEKRIALTLRLDKKRHLSLKLLSAHRNKSGQELMIEALDALLQKYETAQAGCPCLNNLQAGGKNGAQDHAGVDCLNGNNTCQAKN